MFSTIILMVEKIFKHFTFTKGERAQPIHMKILHNSIIYTCRVWRFPLCALKIIQTSQMQIYLYPLSALRREGGIRGQKKFGLH